MNRDPKPEVLRLEELAIMVRTGDIKLPRFQRSFVWKKSDMLKLLDSIYKGYPIGSLLLWNSSQRLTSERDIAGLRVQAESSGFYPTNYLLDGQQRLTTICGALFWEDDFLASIWRIAFDLESEQFFHPKEDLTVSQFPLNKLIRTSEFIRQCMKFEHHPNKNLFVERSERLLRSFKDYKVAVVKIGDMSIEEVAPIFERINSTGRKLTMVDLMMAATWSNGFDLADAIKTIVNVCEGNGFRGVSDASVLRTIATSANLGPNKEDIQRLRSLQPEQLRKATESSTIGLSAATSFLRERTPVVDMSYLPYALQLTHLVEFFRLSAKPTEDQLSELLRWFWYTSATTYFAGASTGQNAKDLALMRAFAKGEIDRLFTVDRIDITRLVFDRFSLRNASSTTFALLLLNAKPDRTLHGDMLELVSHLELTNKLFKSTFENRSRQLNVQMFIDPYRHTSVKWAVDEEGYSPHLLSHACADAVRQNDFISFANIRAQLCAAQLSELTGCEVEFNNTDLGVDVMSIHEETQDRDDS